jgi:hypothetical protein
MRLLVSMFPSVRVSRKGRLTFDDQHMCWTTQETGCWNLTPVCHLVGSNDAYVWDLPIPLNCAWIWFIEIP